MEAAVIRATQDSLGKVIRKPPLTDKLLGKPPFRYLHDIITEVIRTTGFLKGLYLESELKSDNVKDKDAKITFLQKAIDVVSLVSGEPLSVKPARVVAGHEPEKTNDFLQAIGKCCLNKLSSDDAVKRVLSGEKLEPKGKPPSKSQDKENRETKDEERRSRREKEDRHESEIRERSGSRDRKDRQQLKDEERKHSEREKKKDRERMGETEKDGLREGEKNEREKNRARDSRSETDKDRSKEKSERDKGRDRERRSEGSHGKEKDRTRDKEKERAREQEKGRNVEKDSEDQSRERDRERGERNREREDKTRTREHKERKREKDSERERRKDMVRHNENQVDREEKQPEEKHPERKHKTSEENLKKSSDVSSRESKHVTDRERHSVPPKTSRPSASKLRERRPAALGEGASASDDEGGASEGQNTKNASEIQATVPAQRKIPRPGSARPAPPRVKRQPSAEVIVPERVGSGKGVSSVIVDKQKSEDDDSEFVVEETSHLSVMPAVEMETELEDEKHGSLVNKILETKKDYETQPDAVNKDKTLFSDNGRKKEKDMVTKEIEKFRSSIQVLCRSALPLGKIMDYIQEDMDMMQNELKMWRKENREHAEILLREQSITDSAVDPLKAELTELEQLIKEQRDKICTVKGNILRNEEKIQKMLQNISSSSRD